MITRPRFRAHATALPVTLNGETLTALPKEFSTGSLGWHAGGKHVITVDGEPVRCQVGITITVVGSKDLPHT